MKVLFVVPYPTGEAPSQRFRFEHFFPYCEKNGLQYKVAPFWGPKAWKILYTKKHAIIKAWSLAYSFIKRAFLLFSVWHFDFIFIHREATPVGPPWFEWVVAKFMNKKIIFDFDDAIWLPNTSEANKIVSFIKWHNKTSSICKWAWKVSCGNSYLESYARQFNQNVIVNPTVVDTENSHNIIKRHTSSKPITIGWTGTHSTAIYLKIVENVLNKLSKEIEFKFLAISNQKPSVALPGLEYIQWDKEHEIEQLQKIDIGIMPLGNTAWELGKCGFKAIQYSSLGIPTVASPVGANKTVVGHGTTGFFASNDDEWHKYLKELSEDPNLRNKLGNAARMHIVEQFSVRSSHDNFFDMFC